MRKKKGRWFLFLLCIIWIAAGRAEPVQAAEWDSAYQFYQIYGGNKIVLEDGVLYFCTYGRKAAGRLTYRTIGFRLDLRVGGREYRIRTAAGQSIVNIRSDSAVIEGIEYQYNLQSLTFDAICRRLEQTYPQEDFTETYLDEAGGSLMLNGILCLCYDGIPQGQVQEQEDGTLSVQGTVYESRAAILGAAQWDTGNDFLTYFDIVMRLHLRPKEVRMGIRRIGAEGMMYIPEYSLWRKREDLRKLMENSFGRECGEEAVSLYISKEELEVIRNIEKTSTGKERLEKIGGRIQ